MSSAKIVWEGDGAAVVAQWFFETGDTVAAGDVLCELMQEKAVIEVTAPTAGRVEVLAEPDQEIVPGMLLATIAAL